MSGASKDDGEDVDMRDGSASAPSTSPFLLLTPKHELSGSPPRIAQPAKPKFEPKVKPRGGVKARPQQNASVEAKGKQNAPQVEVQGEQKGQTVKGGEKEKKAGVEVVELKGERTAEIIEEVEVKGEQNEEMEVEVKGEDDNPQVEVNGEEVGVKGESLGGDEGHEGQGGDRVVREIDVLLTPNVDGETQVC